MSVLPESSALFAPDSYAVHTPHVSVDIPLVNFKSHLALLGFTFGSLEEAVVYVTRAYDQHWLFDMLANPHKQAWLIYPDKPAEPYMPTLVVCRHLPGDIAVSLGLSERIAEMLAVGARMLGGPTPPMTVSPRWLIITPTCAILLNAMAS
jgi:hypothetical protein